ncbi:MAG: 50S ribosomal protein L35 [Mycobacteriales bacterium]
MSKTKGPKSKAKGRGPKQKSHTGAGKRIKITGSGKLRREQANGRHLQKTKTSKRARRLNGTTDIAPADVKRVRAMLAA